MTIDPEKLAQLAEQIEAETGADFDTAAQIAGERLRAGKTNG